MQLIIDVGNYVFIYKKNKLLGNDKIIEHDHNAIDIQTGFYF